MSPQGSTPGDAPYRRPLTGAERDDPAGPGRGPSGTPGAVNSGATRTGAGHTGAGNTDNTGAGHTGAGKAGATHTDPPDDSVATGETVALIDDADAEGADDAGTGGAGVGGAAGDGGKADGGAVAEDPLATARRERDEYLDMVRRVQADFENFKKRSQRQLSDQLDRASENLVAKLLPALDAFDLARAHLSEDENASADVKALLQASGLLIDVLTKEGLERIDDAGAPFDPTVHDAVEHAPAEDGSDSGVVADVLRSGYRWKGRVIRPAMVRVRG